MTLTKLKSKNQLTIPSEVVKKLRLKKNELFAVGVQGNCITLMPVDVEPRYASDELDAMDKIVEKEKKQGKSRKAGTEFLGYVKSL